MMARRAFVLLVLALAPTIAISYIAKDYTHTELFVFLWIGGMLFGYFAHGYINKNN